MKGHSKSPKKLMNEIQSQIVIVIFKCKFGQIKMEIFSTIYSGTSILTTMSDRESEKLILYNKMRVNLCQSTMP